ncbi:hypothetical protein P691DRAFT_812927 [Macrolepiota fuliginosa MF-IS2]|uniref:X-box-binding protein 1 n=1 Tax=Macrolepiota fuliginosa MF-IS2 TaxID=1400762 RepID=A0A9P5X117_9AGAR|nr:hypothetical protein P691DRAFT_812927 [Macrolepiota fuliginosa MF-IS2]
MSSPSPCPSTPEPGPPRKRSRSEMSSEERKEARAHRNRIAAQNSRDRRKAQFSYFERRVTELEDENRQLRISIGLLSQGQPTSRVPAPISVLSQSQEDLARDRENAELKERIRTLERGWDAVVKALAAQGLPTGLSPSSPTPTQPPAKSLPTPTAAFPSPAPSHDSLDFDIEIPAASSTTTTITTPVFVPTSSTSRTPSPVTVSEDQSSSSAQQATTRHLARVASTGFNTPAALQRVVLRRSSLLSSLTPWQLGNLRLKGRRVRSTNRRWRTSSAKFSSLFLTARR